MFGKNYHCFFTFLKIRALQLFTIILIFSGIIIFTIYLQAKSSDEALEYIPPIELLEKDTFIVDLNENILNNIHYFYQEGLATWYGKNFHRRKTASGEKYNMYSFTCAHRKLPFGTIVRITNLTNNKSIIARINDRGPFTKSKIIDLSLKVKNELEAKDIEKVFIETIIPQYDSVLYSDYVFAFSPEQSPFIISKNFIDIIDSSLNFDEVVDLYYFYKNTSMNKAQDIMVFTYNYPQNNTTYYLAYYEPLKKIIPNQKSLTQLY